MRLVTLAIFTQSSGVVASDGEQGIGDGGGVTVASESVVLSQIIALVLAARDEAPLMLFARGVVVIVELDNEVPVATVLGTVLGKIGRAHV